MSNMRFSVTQHTDIKTSAGVVIFSVNFSDPMPEKALLRVHVVESGYAEAEIRDIGWEKVIGVHTHLLGAGNHNIRFSLIDDGQILGTAEETFFSMKGRVYMTWFVMRSYLMELRYCSKIFATHPSTPTMSPHFRPGSTGPMQKVT